MTEERSDSPEVRLGDAREFYAHAVRTGNERAREQAERALADAREAIARERGLPAEAREELELDIVRLRERLAERANPGEALEREAFEVQLEELDIATLAEASLAKAEGAGTAELIARAGHEAVEENARVQLEALGEQFAGEMAEVDRALAVARTEHLESARRREAVEEEVHRIEVAGRPAGRARGLGLFAAIASLGQIWLAREVFVAASPISVVSSWLLAIGYGLGLGMLAAVVGGLLAASGGAVAQARRLFATVAAAALCAPPVVLAIASSDALAFSTSGGNLIFAFAGLLFVALCMATGYQLREAELSGHHQIETARRDLARARSRYASLRAQRLTLMEVFIARGMTAYAEGARMDALLKLQILQLADEFDERVFSTKYGFSLPSWLEAAHRELRRERDRDTRDTPDPDAENQRFQERLAEMRARHSHAED